MREIPDSALPGLILIGGKGVQPSKRSRQQVDASYFTLMLGPHHVDLGWVCTEVASGSLLCADQTAVFVMGAIGARKHLHTIKTLSERIPSIDMVAVEREATGNTRRLETEMINCLCLQHALRAGSKIKCLYLLSFPMIENQQRQDITSHLQSFGHLLGVDHAIRSAVFVITDLPPNFDCSHKELVIQFFKRLNATTGHTQTVVSTIHERLLEDRVIYFTPEDPFPTIHLWNALTDANSLEDSAQCSLSPPMAELLEECLTDLIQKIREWISTQDAELIEEAIGPLEMLAEDFPQVEEARNDIYELLQAVLETHTEAMDVLKQWIESPDCSPKIDEIAKEFRWKRRMAKLLGPADEKSFTLPPWEEWLHQQVEQASIKLQSKSNLEVIATRYSHLEQCINSLVSSSEGKMIVEGHLRDCLRRLGQQLVRTMESAIVISVQSNQEISQSLERFCAQVERMYEAQRYIEPLTSEDQRIDFSAECRRSVFEFLGLVDGYASEFANVRYTNVMDEERLRNLYFLLQEVAAVDMTAMIDDSECWRQPLARARTEALANLTELLQDLQKNPHPCSAASQLVPIQMMSNIDSWFSQSIRPQFFLLLRTFNSQADQLYTQFLDELRGTPRGDHLAEIYQQIKEFLWMDKYPENQNRAAQLCERVVQRVTDKLRVIDRQKEQILDCENYDRFLACCNTLNALEEFEECGELHNSLKEFCTSTVTKLKHEVRSLCDERYASFTPLLDDPKREILPFKPAKQHLKKLVSFVPSARALGIQIQPEIDDLRRLIDEKAKKLIQALYVNRENFEAIHAILEALYPLTHPDDDVLSAFAKNANQRALEELQRVWTSLEAEFELLLEEDDVQEAKRRLSTYSEGCVLMMSVFATSTESMDIGSRIVALKMQLLSYQNRVLLEKIPSLFKSESFHDIMEQRTLCRNDASFRNAMRKEVNSVYKSLQDLVSSQSLQNWDSMMKIISLLYTLRQCQKACPIEGIYREDEVALCYCALDDLLAGNLERPESDPILRRYAKRVLSLVDGSYLPNTLRLINQT